MAKENNRLMEDWPRISIVTPSFNQGRYIAETVESVLAQDYPNLEYIVIDGGSTDGTLEILGRYPHIKVISEPDRGQAEAINKGFRLATGDIWGFLNSDDTLLPGALHRVAREIDPAQGRHIAMGRCRFVDAEGRFMGIEHPSRFENHRRVLEIWRGHTIPQPAVFWTPEVWRTCGPMDENLKSAWLDYDLFCRFSQKYSFYFVDQVFATYRLHLESKTGARTEAERLEESIQISRRYWGGPSSLLYWQLALSLFRHRFNRVGRAHGWLQQAQESWRHRRVLRALPYALAGGMLAPEVAFYVAAYPPLRDNAQGAVGKALAFLAERRGEYPETAAFFDHTGVWGDDWVGPHLSTSQEAEAGARTVLIQGEVHLRYLKKPFVLTVRVNGQEIARQQLEKSGEFRLELPLPQPLPAGACSVEVLASSWFVPHRYARNRDFRPLAWKLADIGLF